MKKSEIEEKMNMTTQDNSEDFVKDLADLCAILTLKLQQDAAQQRREYLINTIKVAIDGYGQTSLISEKEVRERYFKGDMVRSTWAKLKASGQTPAPINVGGRVCWNTRDLDLWILWGCPGRTVFEARLKMENKIRKK